jgi:hypothetical protein
MNINITLKNGKVLTYWGNRPDDIPDNEVQSYTEEFMIGNYTLLSAGWHQLKDNLLVVVTDFLHTDGTWHKMYQVFCEGPFMNMEHRILLNKMYGWKMNRRDLPAIKN